MQTAGFGLYRVYSPPEVERRGNVVRFGVAAEGDWISAVLKYETSMTLVGQCVTLDGQSVTLGGQSV